MSMVNMPTLFIHGFKDEMVSYKHSEELYSQCNAPKEIILPMFMDHNDFCFVTDLIIPIYDFLQNLGIRTRQKRPFQD